MDSCVILNPRSGGSDNLAEVVARLRRHPALGRVEVRITGEAEDATALAAEAAAAGRERILACGGDGTLNEVVNGVGPHADGIVVGVLPWGTGNDFARSIGFPPNLDAALELLSSAVPRDVDLVRMSGAGDRYFVNCSAGGFSGQVDEELTPSIKQAWGPLAYLRSALPLLPDLQDYETHVGYDGEPPTCVKALNIVVANGRTVAGGIPVAPDARLDDGELDVVIVETGALADLAAIAPRILRGTHLGHELVSVRRARVVTVCSRPGMWFNVDGELVGNEPMEFEALPGALRILAHPDRAPGLGAV